uniref:Transcriptional adapter n=1 Tax=Albugo laibachii Nc14 TaxID=890382 RepID=F0WRK6_9STRA|nr:transcriptional adapter 2alpha putative [Albugo laibachii Nc14]|eukprot:CCA23969.1 transcriptional adapter 2alpha putative [Albugo laibachii Nc14]
MSASVTREDEIKPETNDKFAENSEHGEEFSFKITERPKNCVSCHKDLSRMIRITCSECASSSASLPPVIELCVECFAVGSEVAHHKKTHSYKVSDCSAFPLVCDSNRAISSKESVNEQSTATNSPLKEIGSTNWTAEEDLLLLDGIKLFGMGNWKDIADYIGTKSEKKCEAHYLNAYLSQEDQLPQFIDDTCGSQQVELVVQDESEDAVDPSVEVEAPSTPTKRMKNYQGSKEVRSTTGTTPVKQMVGTELAGYMPLRGDFDVEYDNDAEVILSDMEFAEDDTPTERELKLKVIEIYNSKLDERARRKQFVIEHGLLDYKKHQQTERRRPKEEREIIAQMRPFARFHTREEHEDLIQGLITAMRLQKQIVLLQEYRRNGIKTLAEAEMYEQEKKKRETELAMQKQRDDASYLYDSTRTNSNGKDRASRYRERLTGLHDDEGSDTSSNKRPRTGDSSEDNGRGVSKRIATSLVDGAPGAHLLAPTEKELCSKLQILPKHYLVIKDVLIRECYRLGYLTPDTARQIVKLDVEKSEDIYDFFVSCGWVQREPTLLPDAQAQSTATSNEQSTFQESVPCKVSE